MTKRLIEQWFPTAQVSAESLRERGSSTALPAVNFIHVWWARRPLTASRAASLLSLLPAWPQSPLEQQTPVSIKLHELFPAGETDYHKWVIKTLGILGNSAAHRKKIAIATANGEKAPYGYKRAFTVAPTKEAIDSIKTLAGESTITVLDPFAGGGSIPFEALRLGLSTIASELNPVAAAILTATVALPFQHGPELLPQIEAYGNMWAKQVEARLARFFPQPPNTEKISYIWARAVPCPTTGYPTPLAPNLWLANGDGTPASMELIPQKDGRVETVVHFGADAKHFGERSTYKNGTGVSIWDNGTFDGEYIRNCAENGTMTEILLAVAQGRTFRTPTESDKRAVAEASQELANVLPSWETNDLVPSEEIPVGYTTDQPRRMAINFWRDMFSDRQLLSNVTILETLRTVSQTAIADLGRDRGRAVALYLALSFDRALDYNARLTMWDASRNKIAHVFADHNFAFTTTFGEFEAARELVPWVVKNTLTNYRKLLQLLPSTNDLFSGMLAPAQIINRSATDMGNLGDRSIDAIITDPPYGQNVMYAESSDFFYVWLKRALRDTWPEFCELNLTDKQREAVANPGLFKDVATRKGARKKGQQGYSASELAKRNYDRLMTAAFKESHRVLKDDGIMTVMFTNKEVDMWDTLGISLLNAGFTIESSWPVDSESESSIRIAKKNAARAAIFLSCRKRQTNRSAFWDDIKDEITKTTEEAVHRFANDGLSGVDLTVATYGPALSVLSKYWPVYTGKAATDGSDEIIAPESALNLAREKVAEIKKRGLLDGRSMDFDRPTDWYLIACNDFAAREFPTSDALKLSMAMHIDLDMIAKTYKLATAKSGWASILTPQQRRAAGSVDPSRDIYPSLIDALHALMLVFDEEGLNGARAWLKRTRLDESDAFRALVSAALKAVPRVKKNGILLLPEAKTLDAIRATIFDSIPAPIDDAEQLILV